MPDFRTVPTLGLYPLWDCIHFGPVPTLGLYTLWDCTHFGTVSSLGLYPLWDCIHFGTVPTLGLTQFGTVHTLGLYTLWDSQWLAAVWPKDHYGHHSLKLNVIRGKGHQNRGQQRQEMVSCKAHNTGHQR